ncbi:MAG: hypothetical protein U0175_07715 [Caldilineaceae bacterium]
MNDLPSILQGTQTYRSYLVRFWQSHEEGRWRASAQCVQTGSTVLFADVESLLAYLHKQVATQDGDANRQPFSPGPAM